MTGTGKETRVRPSHTSMAACHAAGVRATAACDMQASKAGAGRLGLERRGDTREIWEAEAAREEGRAEAAREEEA